MATCGVVHSSPMIAFSGTGPELKSQTQISTIDANHYIDIRPLVRLVANRRFVDGVILLFDPLDDLWHPAG